MKVRCSNKSCGNRFPVDVSVCPECGRANELLAIKRRDERPTMAPKRHWKGSRAGNRPQRRTQPRSSVQRKPVDFPERLEATLSMQQQVWWLTSAEGRWRIHPRCDDYPPHLLVDRRLYWRRLHIEAHHVQAEPVPSQEVKAIRARHLEELRKRNLALIGPRAPGTTSIEQKRAIADRAREIDRLASEVDLPPAWADIASCWHLASLRAPIEAALASIGWERIWWLLTTTEGWPEDLVDLARKRLAERRRVGPVREWRADDYLLQDW